MLLGYLSLPEVNEKNEKTVGEDQNRCPTVAGWRHVFCMLQNAVNKKRKKIGATVRTIPSFARTRIGCKRFFLSAPILNSSSLPSIPPKLETMPSDEKKVKKGKGKDAKKDRQKSRKASKEPKPKTIAMDVAGTAEAPIVLGKRKRRSRHRRSAGPQMQSPDSVDEKAIREMSKRTIEFFTMIFPYDIAIHL